MALNGVSFECKPGRIFTLLGPNGAGKTTALRIIATILKPSSGTVSVDGIDAVGKPQEVKAKIGFLTGATGLYERLTPKELVKYFGNLNGIYGSEYNQREDELFTLLGIHDFSNKRIGRLSSGMKQKVSIARTIIHDPDVVVFDEPTSGLDVITAENIIDLIRTCKLQGKTVIFSTHIMGEVSLLSDDIAIIHEGKIIYDGTFDDFKQQMKKSTLVEEFIRIVNES